MIRRATRDLTKRLDAACHLVCFPFAGAGPTTFRGWAAAAPRWVGVWSAHLAGREGRFDRQPLTDLTKQVVELVEAVRPLFDRPVVFYGHSLGATLAAHVAQELFRDATDPCALIVGARPSPWSEPRSGLRREDFAKMSNEDIIQYYHEIGGAGLEILNNNELAEILVPAMRADAELAQAPQFVRERALSVPVYGIYGRDDAQVEAALVHGWCRITSGPFVLTEVAGGHLFLKDHTTLMKDLIIPILLSTVRRAGTAGANRRIEQ